MKTFFTMCITVMTLLLSCAPNSNKESKLNIIPMPNSLVENQGEFELNSQTKWFVADGELNSVVDFMTEKINQSTGFDCQIVNSQPTSNYISVGINAALKQEGYSVSVTPNAIHVSGKNAQGVFYGLQSILQLLPPQVESKITVKDINWTIPAVEIIDEPRFKWRGMHLDVCRHFVPVENIKKHLDMMAMFKMNTFHWHLTEDQAWRIEIKKYPLLTEIGSKRIEGKGFEYSGHYTQEEVKEIVSYAADRFITVVPEIELPGHALAALTAYPEFSCTGGPFKVRNVWGVEPDVFCAGKEETFTFLEDVISEVVALFPSPYFHIGGDECPKERWEECKACQKRIKAEGLENEHELQSYFVKRIEKVLLSHGKKMIGWDEILEGGLAESAAVMSWRGEEGGIEAASQGHDVVMTPNENVYLDHYQGDSRIEPVAIGGYTSLEGAYNYEPVPSEMPADKVHHVLGTQANVWTEYMYTPDLVEYRVYPRLLALAEVNWSNKNLKDYTSFENRLDNQLVRMDLHNINYHIPLPEGPVNKLVFTDNAKLEFSNTRHYKMVYTTDGTEPDAFSKQYKQPLIFAENKIIKIATLLNSGKLSKSRTIVVEKTEFIKSENISTTKIGLSEQYTEGNYITVEDLETVADWKTRDGTIEDRGTNYELLDYKEPTAHIFTGYITIDEDGIYEFQTDLDQFYLANQLLIDNNGDVKRFSRQNTTIALEAGKHAVKLIYLNNVIGGWPQIWNGPAVKFRLLGNEEFTQVTNSMYSF